MGTLVSLLEPRQREPPTQTTHSDTSTDGSQTPTRIARPTHISFGNQPPIFGTLSLSPSSSPSQRENPFERPLLSPALTFYTAPSTPQASPLFDDPPPTEEVSPPHEIVLHVPPPPTATPPSEFPEPLSSIQIVTTTPVTEDDAFPDIDQVPVDPFLEEEGLDSLEKIYLFSRSQATFHRVYITHALPSFLEQITPLEAVQYVLPLLSGLAMDADEQVKEALADELVPIIWHFLTHCQLSEDDNIAQQWNSETEREDVTLISVQAFTPILGTLLLSPNGMVGGAARQAIVEVLSRMRRADEREQEAEGASVQDVGKEEAIGLFGSVERKMFQEEMLQQVVIGMGKLDAGDEGDEPYDWEEDVQDQAEEPETEPIAMDQEPLPKREDVVNPYFPIISSYSSPPEPLPAPHAMHVTFAQLPDAPPHSASYHHEAKVNLSPDPNTLAVDPPIPRQLSPVEAAEQLPTDDYATSDVEFGNEGDEQAAVGRLSSMSLMAAVTASGPLEVETQNAFVKEVERVGKDPIYWVRREASFALGALAKTVPVEVVEVSLLPVFELLRRDSIWHVRHSALFALPAMLTRLSPGQRRSLALDTVVPLSSDESADVRQGVLEALGEVIYTFHEDEAGPPEEILRLFLGRAEDRRAFDEQQSSNATAAVKWGILSTSPTFASQTSDMNQTTNDEPPLELFYKDPARPLICAFNLPAVALTLGRKRWSELRDLYLYLTKDPSLKVRRTLAASLGELAKIIGPDNAQSDLLPVWQTSIKFEEDGEVRTKVLECTEVFIGALNDGRCRKEVAEEIVDVWRAGTLRGWRERQIAAGSLVGLQASIGDKEPTTIRTLLMLALEDTVAAVRETGISFVPLVWRNFSRRQNLLDELRVTIRSLAQSSSFRSRMTYIACQQALVLPDSDGQSVLEVGQYARQDTYGQWQDLNALGSDAIVGVRISLSRFLGELHSHFLRSTGGSAPPNNLQILRTRLSQDSSKEVRSFTHDRTSSAYSQRGEKRDENFYTFSRPPVREPLVAIPSLAV